MLGHALEYKSLQSGRHAQETTVRHFGLWLHKNNGIHGEGDAFHQVRVSELSLDFFQMETCSNQVLLCKFSLCHGLVVFGDCLQSDRG